MNKLEKYRTSVEYREILRLLQKSATLQDNIIWQSHSKGKTIVPVSFMEIDFISREMVANIGPGVPPLDQNIPLYVKLSYRNSIFKINSFSQGPDNIFFSFPELVKTEELRLHPRVTFRPVQEKFVTLRSTMNNLSKEAGNELKVRAIDISETGLGLVVSESNRSFLKNNRILWITGLQDMVMVHPVLAEVVYMNSEVDPKFQIKKQKSLKVGLKISGVFQKDIYEIFLK